MFYYEISIINPKRRTDKTLYIKAENVSDMLDKLTSLGYKHDTLEEVEILHTYSEENAQDNLIEEEIKKFI